MAALFLVPFAVLTLCVFAQFWFVKRIRDTLIDRHPQAYLEAERAAWWPGGGVSKLTRGRAYRRLNDPALNRAVLHLRLLWGFMIGVWLLFIVVVTMFADQLPRSPGKADRAAEGAP